MSRTFKPQVVTANHLLEGDVVYMTRDCTWVRDISKAAVARDRLDAATMLDTAEGQPDCVVGPYLAEVALDPEGRPHPVHFREVFRTTGPTFRTDSDTEVRHV